MGHAYLAAEGCDEATVLGICSSAEEGLMESLMTLHGDELSVVPTPPIKRLGRPAGKGSSSVTGASSEAA
jgi:hypothetical protein